MREAISATAANEIITRQEARERGLPKYRTGRPCKHGHLSERYTNSAICCACWRELARKWRESSPPTEEGKNAAREYQRKRRLDPYYKAALLEGARRAQVPAGQVPPHYDREACRQVYLESVLATQFTGVPHEVDHIIPLSAGGLHSEENLQVLTREENSKKRDEDWRLYGYPKGGRKKKAVLAAGV